MMLNWRKSGLVFAAMIALVATFIVIPPALAAGSVNVEVTLLGDGTPIDGATLTLLAGSTVVAATNDSVDGHYLLTADPGGYLLTVVPPAESAFGPTSVPVSVTAPGPTQITVALVNNTTPPPEVPETVRVSGRVTNAEGLPGDRLRVQFSSSAGIWFAITDRNDGDYELRLPPDNYVVKVSNGGLTGSTAGWPEDIDITYVVPVTVASGVDQTLNLSVPFVPQEVIATRMDTEGPVMGQRIRATGADRSPTATVGGAPAIWSLKAEGVTADDGSATLWVLPGTYDMIGLRGADFAADDVKDDIELPSEVPIEFLFEPFDRPELTGRIVDRAGNGMIDRFGEAGFAIVRAVGTTFPSELEMVASDGTFRVRRLPPEVDGPFELLVLGPDPSSFGTPTYLDARTWELRAGPFALTGNEDVGEIVVPGLPAQICTVGRTTGDPVPAFVSADAMIEDVPVGSITGSLTYSQSLGPSSECIRTVVPPGIEITFEARPSGLDEGYLPTTTLITTSFDPDDPDRVAEITLPLDNFSDLDQDTAVNVDLRLVNTAGLPIGPVSVNLTPIDPIFTRQVFAPDGQVSTRLIRQRHVGTSSGPLPADRAAKRGDVSVTLALNGTDPSRAGVDLGPIEFPYVPVDVTVRGVDGVPLSFALINTNSRQFCADVLGIVEQVCARSTYNARLDEQNDRVVTDQFGRARIWLVPASYTVKIAPPSGGSGYQGVDIPLIVAQGSPGVALFAELPNSAIEPAPVPPLYISAGGPYTVAEGGSIDLTAIVVSGTAASITWDLSGDGEFDVEGTSVAFDVTELSGPAVLPVALRACDADGMCAVQDATSVIVSNVAPLLASVEDLHVEGGDKVEVATTFADPGRLDTHTGSIEVAGSATVVAAVLSPTADSPGSVVATITVPACPTEADCEVPVTVRVSDGFASGTTTFVMTVAGTPGGAEDAIFQDRFQP